MGYDIFDELDGFDQVRVIYHVIKADQHHMTYTEVLETIRKTFDEIRNEKPENSTEKEILDAFISKLGESIKSVPDPYTVIDAVIEGKTRPVHNRGLNPSPMNCDMIAKTMDEKKRKTIQLLMKKAEDEYNEYKRHMMEVISLLEDVSAKKGKEELGGLINGLKSAVSSIPSPFQVLMDAYSGAVKGS